MGGGVVVSRRRHYSVTGGTHSLLSRVDAWAASQSPSKLSPAATGPQKGYDYTIQRGDTLLAIAKAYREQGIKVTTDQILKANPGLDPKSLIVGKKIFIPAPGQ